MFGRNRSKASLIHSFVPKSRKFVMEPKKPVDSISRTDQGSLLPMFHYPLNWSMRMFVKKT